MAAAKILIVDDEPDILALLTEWLEEDGHEVFTASDGLAGLERFFKLRPSLVVTDLRMPRMDGFQFIGRIRETSDIYVLALTALAEDEHVIRGLEAGADEFLSKPVRKRVFLARVRSLLRRAGSPANSLSSSYDDSYLSLNFLTHEAQVYNRQLRLRPTEFKLLAYLTQNQHRVLPHQEILEYVWGSQEGSLDSLKWYISSLRSKLEENPHRPRLIVTAPKVGYRYVPPALQERRAAPAG